MDPYELVASFYEAEYGRLEADIAYFARNGVEGSLLVLGCGTGRVSRALASQRRCVGLDRSAPMLEIASRLAPAAEFVQGDMRDFDLGPFDEIVIPNGGFNFLPTRADQARCMAACARALPVGGQLTLDMPMPDFQRIGEPHTHEKVAWEGVINDREARRTREVRRTPELQRLDLIDRYYVDGELVATSPLLLRQVMPAEAEWMLESAGFYVDAILGEYTGSHVRAGCPRVLVRAVKMA